MSENKANFDIDLVYTWVDDKDPVWLEKKLQYDKSISCDKDANSVCRYFNNDELKYSLRSVEKNIPWINKIFIITDNQVPSWLNLENEKIHIINHKEILPEDKLPLYNACAIENGIANIKELSEHFIYANDDMFFWNKVDKDFFFEGDKPICRVGSRLNVNKKYSHLYGSMIFRAYKLVEERFDKAYPYFPHHNADSYKKSLFLECLKEFQKEANLTVNNRFRNISDLQRMVITQYSLVKNEAVLKEVNLSFFDKFIKRKQQETEFFDIRTKNLEKIRKSKAKLLCINDSRKTTNKDREIVKKIMEEKFPIKSVFEK